MNNCKTCEARCEKEYCFRCKPTTKLPSHTTLKRGKLMINSNKKKENKDIMTDSGVPNGEGVYNNIKMREFFLGIWAKRPHISEVSGEKLFGEANSTYFHHILEKNKYPQTMYDEENIILLSSIEHANVHSDMYRYEEINKRRIKLKEKYGI